MAKMPYAMLQKCPVCSQNAITRCKNALNMWRKCPNFTTHIIIIIVVVVCLFVFSFSFSFLFDMLFLLLLACFVDVCVQVCVVVVIVLCCFCFSFFFLLVCLFSFIKGSAVFISMGAGTGWSYNLLLVSKLTFLILELYINL